MPGNEIPFDQRKRDSNKVSSVYIKIRKIFYLWLTNRVEKIKYWFAKAWHPKFNISPISVYYEETFVQIFSRNGIRVHTYIRVQKYFVDSAMPPFVCYMHSHKINIPFSVCILKSAKIQLKLSCSQKQEQKEYHRSLWGPDIPQRLPK